MKAPSSILVTLVSFFFITGCGSSSKEDKSRLTIYCQECSGMEVSLSRISSRVLGTDAEDIYRSKFDSSGRAKIEFVQSDSTDLLLVVGNRDEVEWQFYATLYFEPGAGIDLTIDKGVPKFEGDLKVINSYYSKIKLVEKERLKYSSANYQKRIEAPAAEREAFMDSVIQIGAELKNQIEKDHALADYYRQLLLSKCNLYEIVDRMFFDTRVALWESDENGSCIVLDSTLSHVFDNLPLHRNYLMDPMYVSTLSGRLSPVFGDIMYYRYENKVKTGEYEYIKGAVLRKPELTEYRELLMALFVAYMSSNSSINYDFGLKLIGLFQKDYPRSKYLEGLNSILARYEDLRAGKPLKDLEMQDINGKVFKLSSLKGNLIYIDVWATWCGPCVEELEYSAKLSKKYAASPDLKFLYVAVNDDKERWKKFLKKHPQVKGVHGIQNPDFLADSNMVTSLYKINGIPRYILIDKHGKIITVDAKRPSELVSGNYLDSLLAL